MSYENGPFRFATGKVSCDTAEVFYAHINPEISLKQELLNNLYYSLWFPGYFGFNWDALYDCLRDFHWTDAKKIVIVHDVLPQIPEMDLSIYLEVLRDSVLEWRVRKSLELEVFFQEGDRGKITNILAEV